MDADYIAFRELVRWSFCDPILAAELTRAMTEGWPLARLLAVASATVARANDPARS